jgi:hypothetical protein
MADEQSKVDPEHENAELAQKDETEGDLALDAAEAEEVKGGGYPPLPTYVRSPGPTG